MIRFKKYRKITAIGFMKFGVGTQSAHFLTPIVMWIEHRSLLTILYNLTIYLGSVLNIYDVRFKSN